VHTTRFWNNPHQVWSKPNTVKPVLRDHLWDQEKSDLIRQVTS